MGSLTVRPFKIADYHEVRTLWEKSGLEIRPGDSKKEILTKLKRDPELFLVAEADGKIVGTVIGAWDGRRGWIYHLGVLPGSQRRGVATKLLHVAESRMRRKGVVKVNASIHKWNRKSQAFFKKNGYEADLKTIHYGKFFGARPRPRRRSV